MSTQVFPSLAGLEYPVRRTPIFNKIVQTAASGNEVRAALWSMPRWQWTLSFNFLRDDSNNEFRTLLGFYLARQGAYDSFLFTDPDDNSVTSQTIATTDGASRLFQLNRTFGGFTENVLAPNTVTTLKVNGVTKVQGTDYYVAGWQDATYPPGTIYFLLGIPAAGNPITVTYSYYWPVRFLEDQYDFDKFMNKLWEQKKLELISLKSG